MAKRIIETATLNFTDLTGAKTGCTSLGSNKFWKGWVEDNGDGTFSFECKWGPTGEPGSDKGSKRGIGEADALKTLRGKVREKEAKGYTRLATRTDEEEIAKATAKGGAPTPVKATKVAATTGSARSFHSEVSRLLGIIYNETSRVVRAGLSAQAGATEDNPIGNLSDAQLDVGGSILDEIQTMLDRASGGETPTNRASTLPPGRDGMPDTNIIALTNRYMSNVPRAIGRELRGRENLHRLVVSSYERLEEQRKFLQLLRDAALSKDVFQAAAHAAPAAGGKEAIWYDGLGCLVEFCEAGSADFRRVKEIFETGQSRNNSNWFRGNQSTLRVSRVFKFTRNGTSDCFDRYAQGVLAKPAAVGKIFAWHGTRVANILGISRSGLLMPENLPRGCFVNGKAFGAGIYHAPMFTGVREIQGVKTDGSNGALKSANYMGIEGSYYGTGNTGRNGFMFLQEVALG